MIRIYGNRELKTLSGKDTRPTTARVREAVFNIWQGKITDCKWLDLCAGNGAMGAEALCRGASEVVGIEKSANACNIIRYNWQKVANFEQKIKILRGDILVRLPKLKGAKFDLIYFDPPYDSNLYEPVLKQIVNLNLLNKNGEIAVEYNPKIWQNTSIKGLEIQRTKVYGNTALNFYKHVS